MSLPTSRDVTYAPGVPIDSATLNDLQDQIIALYATQQAGLVASVLKGLYGDGLFHRSTWSALRPLARAGAIYQMTVSSTPVIKFRRGLWVQSGGPSDQPYLAYVAADDEINVTLSAVPGGGSYRRDIISVKLVYTAGVISIVAVLTAGTPAGSIGAAAEPATPAGYVKIASVMVGNGSTTVDPTYVRDYRVPLGYRVVDSPVDSEPSFVNDPTHWSYGLQNMTSDGAAARSGYIMAPPFGRDYRVMMVGLVGYMPASPAAGALVALGRFNVGTDVSIQSVLTGLESSLVNAEGVKRYREADLSATPFWLNGWQAPVINDSDATPRVNFFQAAMLYTSASNKLDTIWRVRWHLAGWSSGEAV